MKIMINAENASMRMSGETSIPIYYFDLLRERNVDVWMVCHARVRDELSQLYSNDPGLNQIHFIEDSWIQKQVHFFGNLLPYRISDLIIGQMVHILTQLQARSVVKHLIKEHGIQLVFEPSPITPKGLSFMYEMGVPVVIGPLCGGIDFPLAFRDMDVLTTRLAINLGRLVSLFLNRLVPGKLKADILLVGNQRTIKALPSGYQGKVYQVAESGVDLSLWQPITYDDLAPNQPVRFVFLGRFVDWKGMQFLVEAFKLVAEKNNAVLEMIGDGELFEATKAQAKALGLQERIIFHGRLPLSVAADLMRSCHVYVAPALRESGGCALLEAMAAGFPIIATNWGGPGEFVNSSCGILVEPTSRQEFVDGLAAAMVRLANDPELRQQMGLASQQRVRTNYYDWDSKVDRVLEIFAEVLQTHPQNPDTPDSKEMHPA